ncbi:MAG: polysaccharide deacetylase family protein [Deltaproteobacteria bacterium]|nr:polysaccharide deacetylase family protein [Deltaproteobacteria bacterium]
MMYSPKHPPVLTVQVDVDTQRNLFSFYGFEEGPGYEDNVTYQHALPRFARLFAEVGIQATFFVIGEDLAHERNRRVIRDLHRDGHEIANHTQTHPYQFCNLSLQDQREEIRQAGQTIAEAIQVAPVGFRAPGYDVTSPTLTVLTELGYQYDSSVMPSILNPVLKLTQSFMNQKGVRSGYGDWRASFAPTQPYHPDSRAVWRAMPSGPLWEIPVASVPYCRLPFYANFNLFSGTTLFRLSAGLASGRDCNYVFHAIELLGPEEIDPRLHRHPNARLSLEDKFTRCRTFLRTLIDGRRPLLSREFARELSAGEVAVPTPESGPLATRLW